MGRRLILITGIAILIAAGFLMWRVRARESRPAVVTPSSTPAATPVRRALLDVPFISQAPFGEWSDPRQEDGCEEASTLMAMHWVRGTTTTKEQALADMRAVTDFEERHFGTWHDLSANDIVVLLRDYYRYDGARVRRGITIADIKREIAAGNIVIAPMNGRLLNNPYFTPPGPEYHMVLVKGFDDATGEFITNDPGLKTLGKSYRYPYRTLYDAIREYPTGYHEPVFTVVKTMIVIKK